MTQAVATQRTQKPMAPKLQQEQYGTATHIVIRWRGGRRVVEPLCSPDELLSFADKGWPDDHEITARFIDGDCETIRLNCRQVLLIANLKTALAVSGK